MAIKKFNSADGFSVGSETFITVIDNVANVTANSLTVTAKSDLGAIGNITVTGGSDGYTIVTDGAGHLSWQPAGGSGSGFASVTKDNFVGTGSQDSFLLTTAPSSEAAVEVNLNGLIQQGYVYSIVGSNVVFTTPPSAGANIEVTVFGVIDFTQTDMQALFISGTGVAGSDYFKFNSSTNTLIIKNILSNGVVDFTTTTNVSLGDVSNIHISGGTLDYVLRTDGAGQLSWVPQTGGGAGNANIAGANTYIFFNDNNSNTLGASSKFTFDKGTNTLSVVGNIVSSNANLGNSVIANYFIGDGSLLTGLTGGSYSNSNVAAYLPTYSGNFTSGNINVSYTTTSTANLGNVVVANYFVGNGSLLTGLPASYSNTNVAAYLPTYNGNITAGNISLSYNTTSKANLGNIVIANYVTGTLTTGYQPNITGVGTLANATLSANGNITMSGTLSKLSGANLVSATYLAGTLTSSAQPNITSVSVLTSLSVSGNIDSGNIDGGNVVLANYFIGDGSLLTGIPDLYSNANVEAYLPTFTGTIAAGNANITGNITTGTGTGGNITGANYIIANYFFGDGGLLSNINIANIAGSYSNSNVSSYLPTFTGNVKSGNANLGNVVVANYFVGNGSLLTGLPASYSNTNVAAYLPTYSGNLTASNINLSYTTTSTANLGNVVVANYVLGNGSLLTGIVTNYSNANVAAYLPTYSGNINAGNIDTSTLYFDTGLITVSGTLAGVFTTGVSNINFGVGSNITMGSTTGNTTVQGNLYAGNLDVTTTATITNLKVNDFYSNRTPITVTTNTVVDSFPINKYRSAKYTMRVNSDDGYQAIEVLLIHDGSDSYVTIYGSLSTIGTEIVTLSSTIVTGYVRLLATTGSPNTTVNLLGTYVAD